MEQSAAEAKTGRKIPRAVPIVLVVLATIVGIASVFAVWGKRQLLEDETWAKTSGRLIQDPAIQEAVADFVTASIFDNVDVQGVLADRLPEDLKPLSGPIAAGVRSLADEVALKALQQPRVQQLWVEANRTAHHNLVELIEDRNDYISTTGGVVTLDLKSIIVAVTGQLGIGEGAVEKLPPKVASFEIARAQELATAQRAVHALQTAAWLLSAIAVLLYLAAVAAAPERRREALRSVGISLIAIGLLVLVSRGFARDAVVGSLSETVATDAAVRAAFDEGTSLLVETCQSIVGYGLVLVIAAWLAGPTGAASAVRRAIAPYLRQPRFAFGGVGLLLVLLFWWDPVVATHRLAPSLLLIVLVLVGTEVLRRQVIREFPDAVTARSPAGIARGMAEWAAAARERRILRRSEAMAQAAPGGDRVALLERLGTLRDSGVLSEDEFAAEKARILAG